MLFSGNRSYWFLSSVACKFMAGGRDARTGLTHSNPIVHGLPPGNKRGDRNPTSPPWARPIDFTAIRRCQGFPSGFRGLFQHSAPTVCCGILKGSYQHSYKSQISHQNLGTQYPIQMTLHVSIVGAGIGGLAAAIALRRNGHPVQVCG